MNVDLWAEGWREDVAALIRARGYSGPRDFMSGAPTAPYRELAAALGAGVAPVQLEILAREECLRTGDLNFFARDCLIRYLHRDLPDGWGRGPDTDFRTARAFASWSAALGEGHRGNVDCVFSRCGQQAVPGWLPQGADDPLLIAIFAGLSFFGPTAVRM